MFEAVMHRLGDRFDMLAVDLPGFGQSFDPPPRPGVGYYAAVLLEALDRLGWSSCHVAGHHAGASVAAELAMQTPDRMDSVALFGPPYYGSESEREARRTAVVRQRHLQADGGHLQDVWQRVAGSGDRPVSLAHREAVATLRAYERFHEAQHAVFDHDLAALLPRIRQPLLLACGTADVLWSRFEPACQARPDAEHATLPGGTMIMDEQPDAVAATLAAFWEGARR